MTDINDRVKVIDRTDGTNMYKACMTYCMLLSHISLPSGQLYRIVTAPFPPDTETLKWLQLQRRGSKAGQYRHDKTDMPNRTDRIDISARTKRIDRTDMTGMTDRAYSTGP
jgi:hypothetical protein